ncbi:hypothetical protein FRC14_002210 [Serendipita sp. 396]|nr:hypothetical protein FRC14_002210 [Serendipita sp. 396]KAG8823091.1 hypothetical protein FRC19_004617 [Serendipita sp. 401]KAG8831487.1 hypothetical protein FRC18_006452 [Serendipita sp. 400]KAG8855736.1 hypothetical protein FRB91_001850 [Serendipita sp. 411]
MSLAEEVEARKARLQALRARKAGTANGEAKNAIEVLSKRNFDPETRTLRKTDGRANEDTIEKNVDGLVERILEADQQRQEAELDLMNIAPKRANWDLKRDLNKKLAPLEKVNKEAIYTIVRARIKSESNDASKDLASAIDARAAAEESASDDE